MPVVLFRLIEDFLARGASPGTPEGPHTLPYSAAATMSPSAWSPTHSHQQFLPLFTLGKGERSIHCLLFDFLVNRGPYYVIPEFSVKGRLSVDLLVIDKKTDQPIAAIEMKHYSVHQTGGVDGLLGTPVANPNHPSLDADYLKRDGSYVRWGSGGLSLISNPPSVPPGILKLIQIGLLTAIYDPAGTIHHPVGFLRSYLKGNYNSISNAPRSVPSSANEYDDAPGKVHKWWNNHKRKNPSHYSRGIWGWGPAESFSPPALLSPLAPVVGRVGYVSVMT